MTTQTLRLLTPLASESHFGNSILARSGFRLQRSNQERQGVRPSPPHYSAGPRSSSRGGREGSFTTGGVVLPSLTSRSKTLRSSVCRVAKLSQVAVADKTQKLSGSEGLWRHTYVGSFGVTPCHPNFSETLGLDVGRRFSAVGPRLRGRVGTLPIFRHAADFCAMLFAPRFQLATYDGYS